MPNSRHIIEDFICSISACSQEAELDDILRTIQSSQYPIIAVVDRQEYPIGVVDGRRLLAFAVKQCLKIDHNNTKFIDWKQVKTGGDLANSFELTNWIEPVVSFKSDLSLEELLLYFQEGIITHSDRQNYIVTDSAGKLLGLLDTFRLSQWLLTHQIKLDRSSLQQPVKNIPSLDSPIFKFLEQVSLPLMLQTELGSILYQNQCWQQQVGNQKISNLLEISNFVQSIDSTTSSSLKYINRHTETTPYCLKGNYYLAPSFANSSPHKITFESQEILDAEEKKQVSKSFDAEEKKHLQSPVRSSKHSYSPTVKTEWQYLKLPLELTDHQLSSSNLTSPVSLLIAIKVSATEQLDRQQSQQKIELVKLNQLKDELLTSISHELKSPLTAIVGLSSLLKEEKLGKLNHRQIRYSELIYRSGRQLMKTVGDMLELSYLATGKLKLNFESIKIRNLCTEAYQKILNRLEESHQFEATSFVKPSFKLSLAKDLEIISADEVRLRQVLTYLLDNAVKFLQWKETTLSTLQKKITITINHWSSWIAITIEDNGIGIPEEVQNILLERCFQSGDYLDHRYDEIGLGLILSHQLAKAHGGDISFVSCWGRGSKFTVLLPSSSHQISSNVKSNLVSIASVRKNLEFSYYNNHHKQQSQDSTIPSENNLLVLVIDSVVTQINELDLQLKKLGYYPIIARTATEALQKAYQLKPSRIFLNPSLSKSSKTDILTLLKSDSLTTKIPVFLLVTKGWEQQNYGQADGFLNLPIEQESLKKLIPLVQKDFVWTKKRLTILHLYPESETTSNLKIAQNSDLNFALNEHLSGLNHRVLEADSLEQGEILARIWQIDAIVLDGRILQEPVRYLRSLKKSTSLSSLPLVTLDTKTTEAANQIEGLAVFPCLLPENKSNLANLVQVIQIAAGINNNED